MKQLFLVFVTKKAETLFSNFLYILTLTYQGVVLIHWGSKGQYGRFEYKIYCENVTGGFMKKVKCILLFISLIMILFFIIMRNDSERGTLRIEYNGNQLVVFFIDENRSINGEKIVMESWSDKENHYYIFLPAYKENTGCKIVGYGFDELKWNNQTFDSENSNEKLSLQRGKNSLVIDNTEFILNICFNSEIPTIYIETDSGSADYINADRENLDKGYLCYYNKEGTRIVGDDIRQIRSRGNATWELSEKKSYGFTLENPQNMLPEYFSKKYVLISNTLDSSYLRNKLIYDLGIRMDMKASPLAEFVDVYMDGEFLGLYLLCSKIQIADESINISDLEDYLEEGRYNFLKLFENTLLNYKGGEYNNISYDIKGGYLLEYEMPERYLNEKSGFTSAGGQSIVIKSPVITPKEGVRQIRTLYQAFEDAVMNKSGYNVKTKKYYTDYIDVESWVERYLVEEIAKNNDFGLSSNYFYIDTAGEAIFYAGPIWDYDCAMGHEESRFDYSLRNPEGIMALGFQHPEYKIIYGLLYQHDNFRQEVQKNINNLKRK